VENFTSLFSHGKSFELAVDMAKQTAATSQYAQVLIDNTGDAEKPSATFVEGVIKDMMIEFEPIESGPHVNAYALACRNDEGRHNKILLNPLLLIQIAKCEPAASVTDRRRVISFWLSK
jgi:hypothetical protein